jgi:uncharacterized protein
MRVTHFEIPSDEPEKLMDFYKKTFGWNYQQFGGEPYWLAFTGDPSKPGINGGIMKKKHPQQPMVNSLSVDNIHETIKEIETNGGQIVVPVSAIPGVGWLAYFKDPDQNIFGVMQEDANAK